MQAQRKLRASLAQAQCAPHASSTEAYCQLNASSGMAVNGVSHKTPVKT